MLILVLSSLEWPYQASKREIRFRIEYQEELKL
jgi:hypothetical protein